MLLGDLFELLKTFIVCLGIYHFGACLIKRYPQLDRLNLPTAVIGGLLFAILFFLLKKFGNIEFHFPMYLRDFFLVVFFCCVGLSVRFADILKGGRGLVVLCLLSILLVILQNLIGVLTLVGFGMHPLFGLLAGSVPFVGGYGSSLAWGHEWESQGLNSGLEFAFACSTLGLVAGGLCAGPVASLLLHKNGLGDLTLGDSSDELKTEPKRSINSFFEPVGGLIRIFIIVLVCIALADLALPQLLKLGFHLPRFLVAMLFAMVIINFIPSNSKWCIACNLDLLAGFSFNTVIILSLIGLKLDVLSAALVPLLTVFILQIILTVLYAIFVVFRAMGRDYDAAVISSGVVGFGLSSLTVAVATVQSVTKNYGPAPRALLLTSLVGAALIDLANNLIILFLSELSFFQI